jgi:hypothetical protein
VTLQTLTIGKKEFVLIVKRDFQRLAEQAERQAEDDYWIRSALDVEAKAKAKKQKPIPFQEIEAEWMQKEALSGEASEGLDEHAGEMVNQVPAGCPAGVAGIANSNPGSLEERDKTAGRRTFARGFHSDAGQRSGIASPAGW